MSNDVITVEMEDLRQVEGNVWLINMPKGTLMLLLGIAHWGSQKKVVRENSQPAKERRKERGKGGTNPYGMPSILLS